MFPLKNYYETFIKKEIVGIKKEDVIKRLGNLLACPVVTKETKESVHVRFFTYTMDMKPSDNWMGTFALRIENGIVKESAISVPGDKKR